MWFLVWLWDWHTVGLFPQARSCPLISQTLNFQLITWPSKLISSELTGSFPLCTVKGQPLFPSHWVCVSAGWLGLLGDIRHIPLWFARPSSLLHDSHSYWGVAGWTQWVICETVANFRGVESKLHHTIVSLLVTGFYYLVTHQQGIYKTHSHAKKLTRFGVMEILVVWVSVFVRQLIWLIHLINKLSQFIDQSQSSGSRGCTPLKAVTWKWEDQCGQKATLQRAIKQLVRVCFLWWSNEVDSRVPKVTLGESRHRASANFIQGTVPFQYKGLHNQLYDVIFSNRSD